MRTISSILGTLNVRTIRPKHVLQLQDSFSEIPTKVDHIIAMLSTLMGWGVPRDFADSNPCRNIGDLVDSDGYPPWEWEDVEYVRDNLVGHPGVQSITLGSLPHCAGKVARLLRIDTRIGDSSCVKCAAQRPVVLAGRLEDGKTILARGQPIRQSVGGLRAIGQALRPTTLRSTLVQVDSLERG